MPPFLQLDSTFPAEQTFSRSVAGERQPAEPVGAPTVTPHRSAAMAMTGERLDTINYDPWWEHVDGPFPKWDGPVGCKVDGGGNHRGQGRVGKMVVWRAVHNRDEEGGSFPCPPCAPHSHWRALACCIALNRVQELSSRRCLSVYLPVPLSANSGRGRKRNAHALAQFRISPSRPLQSTPGSSYALLSVFPHRQPPPPRPSRPRARAKRQVNIVLVVEVVYLWANSC